MHTTRVSRSRPLSAWGGGSPPPAPAPAPEAGCRRRWAAGARPRPRPCGRRQQQQQQQRRRDSAASAFPSGPPHGRWRRRRRRFVRCPRPGRSRSATAAPLTPSPAAAISSQRLTGEKQGAPPRACLTTPPHLHSCPGPAPWRPGLARSRLGRRLDRQASRAPGRLRPLAALHNEGCEGATPPTLIFIS